MFSVAPMMDGADCLKFASRYNDLACAKSSVL